jgi:hypothetical protein
VCDLREDGSPAVVAESIHSGYRKTAASSAPLSESGTDLVDGDSLAGFVTRPLEEVWKSFDIDLAERNVR